jgi:GT2 family glycosyltransferase
LSSSAEPPLVSIIILNHNGSRFIANCLNSIFESLYPAFEIIFVDNASTDDSLSIVNGFKKLARSQRLIIVRNSSNLGYAEGNNIGASYAQGTYLVFLNNDTRVEPTWLQELVDAVARDQDIIAAQSKLLLFERNERVFDSAGDFIDFFCSAFRRGVGERDFGQYETMEEVFSARGACMLIRHSIFKEVGGFDPGFPIEFEDIDLCWRIRLGGYKVVYVPRSVVFHKGHGTISDLRKVRRDPQPLLMIKNYDASNLLFFLSLYFVVTLGAFVNDILERRNRSSVLARFNAIRWTILNLRSVLEKRYAIQRVIRRVPDNRVKRMMLQPSLALYTRFLLEMRRAMPNQLRLEKLYKWYFSKTDPYRRKTK